MPDSSSQRHAPPGGTPVASNNSNSMNKTNPTSTTSSSSPATPPHKTQFATDEARRGLLHVMMTKFSSTPLDTTMTTTATTSTVTTNSNDNNNTAFMSSFFSDNHSASVPHLLQASSMVSDMNATNKNMDDTSVFHHTGSLPAALTDRERRYLSTLLAHGDATSLQSAVRTLENEEWFPRSKANVSSGCSSDSSGSSNSSNAGGDEDSETDETSSKGAARTKENNAIIDDNTQTQNEGTDPTNIIVNDGDDDQIAPRSKNHRHRRRRQNTYTPLLQRRDSQIQQQLFRLHTLVQQPPSEVLSRMTHQNSILAEESDRSTTSMRQQQYRNSSSLSTSQNRPSSPPIPEDRVDESSLAFEVPLLSCTPSTSSVLLSSSHTTSDTMLSSRRLLYPTNSIMDDSTPGPAIPVNAPMASTPLVTTTNVRADNDDTVPTTTTAEHASPPPPIPPGTDQTTAQAPALPAQAAPNTMSRQASWDPFADISSWLDGSQGVEVSGQGEPLSAAARTSLPFSILGTSADDVSCHPHVLSPPLMESLLAFVPEYNVTTTTTTTTATTTANSSGNLDAADVAFQSPICGGIGGVVGVSGVVQTMTDLKTPSHDPLSASTSLTTACDTVHSLECANDTTMVSPTKGAGSNLVDKAVAAVSALGLKEEESDQNNTAKLDEDEQQRRSASPLSTQLPSSFNYWLKYSLVRDGPGMWSFLRKVRASTLCVLAIETTNGHVFGAFTSQPWRLSKGWYGGQDTFLWKMRQSRKCDEEISIVQQVCQESEVQVYPYRPGNAAVQYCCKKCVALGQGEIIPSPRLHDPERAKPTPLDGGKTGIPNTHYGYALYLDKNLLSGTTSSSETFGNPCLIDDTRRGARFTVSNIEVWTLTPHATEAQAEQSELSNLFLDGGRDSSHRLNFMNILVGGPI